MLTQQKLAQQKQILIELENKLIRQVNEAREIQQLLGIPQSPAPLRQVNEAREIQQLLGGK